MAPVSVTVGPAIGAVWPEFLSFTLDAAWFCQEASAAAFLDSPITAARASHLAPFAVRVGGTQADFSQFAGGPLLPPLESLPGWTDDYGCNYTAESFTALKRWADELDGVRLAFAANGHALDEPKPQAPQ